MSTAGPGDLVEALYDFRDARIQGCEVRRGKFYVVEMVVPIGGKVCWNGHVTDTGLVLERVPAPQKFAWCARCFRPIGRPAQGLINSINQWIAEGAPLKEGEIA